MASPRTARDPATVPTAALAITTATLATSRPRSTLRTAAEIAERFPIAFASVSHHLGVLKGADLVATEREGQFIRYRLNTTVFQEVVRYFMTRFSEKNNA